MARLYANENFPLPVVESLQSLGHDVLTTLTAGNAGQAIPDEAVLAFAIAHQRALLTLNRRHFLRIAQVHPQHFGLIICTFDADFGRQANAIHASINASASLRDQIIRINRPPAP